MIIDGGYEQTPPSGMAIDEALANVRASQTERITVLGIVKCRQFIPLGLHRVGGGNERRREHSLNGLRQHGAY